jgi:serine/threonine-protein kinase
MIGEILGNYRILKKLGEGGMGTVYLARDLSLEREVAIKIISPELARNPRLMARFRVEAIAQAKLNHSNITVIHSFDQEKDNYYIVMEFVDGNTLKHVIKEKGKMPLPQAMNIFSQILKAIAYAHSRGVVHRDIKPSNILLTKDQRAKIGDFGIAKVEGIEGLTKMGTTLGSPLYSSPEQLMGKKIDDRTDIYSLGITLYQMVTGELPFKPSTDSEYQVIQEVLKTTIRKPSELDKTIPPEVDAVIMKSLAKALGDRFKGAMEFDTAIKELMIPAPQPAPPKKETTKKKRIPGGPEEAKGMPAQKRVIMVALVLGIILVSVVIFLVYSGKNEPGPQTIPSGPSHNVPQTNTSQTQNDIPSFIQPDPKKVGKQPSAVMGGGVSSSLSKMDWWIKKKEYANAVEVGNQAIENGTVSGDIYQKLAQAYYYDGKERNARRYYWKILELGESFRFKVHYEYKKNKTISGTLAISESMLSFSPHREDLGSLGFSIRVSQIKRVSDDLVSDITGIFKKKKKRKNPALVIKDKQKEKYIIQVKSQDSKLRSFIKDIIKTLKK